MSIISKKFISPTMILVLAFLIFSGAIASWSVFAATSSSGAVKLNAEVSSAIAMKIVSPNDIDPNCTPEEGATYGVVNRYAMSNGTEGSKQVDTFDGTPGGKDEVNTNTSCATLAMTPNTYDSTYSDVSVYTNSPSGFALSLQASEPNLVNMSDNSQYIPAGVLTETDGTGEQAGQKVVPGGQNLWSYKTDGSIITDWTAMTSVETTIKSYEKETTGGDTTKITYGISTGTNPTGTYATNVTYTATAFDSANPYVGNVQATETANLSITPLSLAIPLKTSKSLTVTPSEGYYLSEVDCPEGYACSGYTTDKSNEASKRAQTITITNQSAGPGVVSLGLKVEKTMPEFFQITKMQEMTPSICNSVPTPSSSATASMTAANYDANKLVEGGSYVAEATLSDVRDTNSYVVRKLADGNCWMVQNLRLKGYTLTPADSDVSSDFVLPSQRDEFDVGHYDSASVYDSGNKNYGVYYSWTAATAGAGITGVFTTNTSICSKGWKLPASNDFETLLIKYDYMTSVITNTNMFAGTLAGARVGNASKEQGTQGAYWASDAPDDNSVFYAYGLHYYGAGRADSYVESRFARCIGITVRCLTAN